MCCVKTPSPKRLISCFSNKPQLGGGAVLGMSHQAPRWTQDTRVSELAWERFRILLEELEEVIWGEGSLAITAWAAASPTLSQIKGRSQDEPRGVCIKIVSNEWSVY